MPDLLSGLNPQQHQAVTANNGPTLVVAGPGSGKTRVLTQRIAWLVQQGVPPFRIMAVTFTNKAAREMRERVERLMGDSLGGLTIGTFHSICARFLRREAGGVGAIHESPLRESPLPPLLDVTRDFVIFDSSDQQAVVKQVLERLKIDDKQYKPQMFLSAISKAKNELIQPQDYPVQTYADEIKARVYAGYQKGLRENNAFDFDDLLTETVYLFRAHPDLLKKYQEFYEHVLVDEFQDTNTAQYTLIKLLTATKRNIYVVGDPDQCFPAGTLITTPAGKKPIEKIKRGDVVLAASGRGSTLPSRVAQAGRRSFTGELIKVKTRTGHTFQATSNHIVFTRLGMNPGLHYVYLMYRQDKGYRVGVASHARSDGASTELKISLQVRSNQENADRIWVLKVCQDRNEAQYWESFYAFTYSIPTTIFHVRGRNMRMSQDYIDKLFSGIDTHTNALKLMADLEINEKYPHYIPQGTYRNVVNLRYFGDGRKTLESPWHAHRVDLWSSDPELAKTLKESGYNPRIRSRKNWRIGLNRLHYDDIQEAAQKLSQAVGDADIVVGAFLVDKGRSPTASKFSLMPASQLHSTMILAVEKNGKIVEDEIIEISRVPYKGNVYDFEVENLHNYLAGGVVVHNSVYRWRGADYRNVRRFQDDNPDALTVLLEQNYRSTQLILDAAMAVIDQNKGRTRKELFTEREGGLKIQGYEAYNEEEEALYIIQTISTLAKREKLDPADVAIMYRTNAQSRALEDAFVRAGLPYRIVGAQRFYGRREVKDVIAFLRLVHNPADSISLMRVINVPPRSLGAKTLETLQVVADSAQVPVSAIIRDLGLNRQNSGYASQFKGKAGAALSEFGARLNDWIALKESSTVAKIIDRILADTDYRRYINDGTDEGEERWENVMELRGVAAEAENISLSAFLEDVALVADADTLNEGAGPTLLTLHAAKGLEFPVVFITGLNEGVLPHQRSLEDAEEMAEERRLLYVGVTRAKDRLFLTRSFRQTVYGNYEVAAPSRFLGDIPERLLTGVFTKKKSADESAYARMTDWKSSWDADDTVSRRGEARPHLATESHKPSKRETAQTQARYRTGQRVKHPTFGEGMIIESRGSGDDEIVVIAFEGTGIKRLAANMVELKVLKG